LCKTVVPLQFQDLFLRRDIRLSALLLRLVLVRNSDRSILTASLPSRLVRSIPTPPHIAYHTYTYIHTVHTYIRHAVPTRAFPTRNTPPRSRQRRTTTQRTRNTTALRTRRGRTRELLCLAIQRGELFLAKATNASRLEQHRRRGLRRPTDRLID
jgi:hypothetical protein